MKRPSFQFYPADWRNNAKLRRCSLAARGAWIEVLGLLHDADRYGVLAWPLSDLAMAAGVPIELLHELVEKGVLKGCDKGARCEPLVYVPRHAGQDGPAVTLIGEEEGPIWYSSRFVRDEHVRLNRGKDTRFGQSDATSPPRVAAPIRTPKGGIGDGSTSSPTSSSSSTSSRDQPSASSSPSPSVEPRAPGDPRDVAWEEQAINILEHLNAVAGRKFACAEETLKPIMSRLRKGASVREMMAVVDVKAAEWRDDEKMKKHLKPATLFGGKHYEEYAAEARDSEGRLSLEEWISAQRDAGAASFGDDIEKFIDEAGLQWDWFLLVWQELRDRERAKPRRIADWRGELLSAVRENKFRLWFAGPNGLVLSPQGQLAENTFRARKRAKAEAAKRAADVAVPKDEPPLSAADVARNKAAIDELMGRLCRDRIDGKADANA